MGEYGRIRKENEKPTRKRQSHDDKHFLEGPFHVESGQGYVEPSSLHTLWIALCNEKTFGMSLRAHVLDPCIIHFEAVGRSRLLIPAPLSNPGIKSGIREKIPGGWRITFHDNHPVRIKLDFKLAWRKV